MCVRKVCVVKITINLQLTQKSGTNIGMYLHKYDKDKWQNVS